MNAHDDKLIARTPHPDCPACKAKRLHQADEWKTYHPDAGTGVDLRNNRTVAKQ